jgi:hypothetical protein
LRPQTTVAPNYHATEEEPRLPVWRRATAGVAVMAAMLLLAVGVVTQKPDIVFPTSSDSFAVATADDVEIVSVQGDDSMLVVGVPPVHGPIEFATVGDVVGLAIDNGATIDPKDPKSIDPLDPKKGSWILPGSDNKTLPTP